MKDRAAFQAALTDHTRAIEAFLSAARRVPEAGWPRPVAEDKWSPGQIAEHLCLSLEAVAGELSGNSGMRYRLSWWKRFLARRRYLPGILRTRRFPSGARAPRETRPSAAAAPRAEALARLAAASAAIERIAAENPRAARRRLRHPYFGALSAADFFAVIALHADHHRGQLPVS
ncbi:MAG: DinB family protein [Thermoanaerobaculia bacterium]